jgi:uncharacterized protein YjbI with pentapeptide repeats
MKLMTTNCEYDSSKGNRCQQPAAEDSKFCQWHIPAGKHWENDDEVKAALEQICRDGQSLTGFFIQKVNLHDIALNNADLENADFSRSNLSYAHLYGANLNGANLFKADLTGANLRAANLIDCNFLGTNLYKTKFDNAAWDRNYVIINEKDAIAAEETKDFEIAQQKYKEAEEIYRNIKLSLGDQGHGRDESHFFYREMIVHRKQMPRLSFRRFFSKMMDLTTGYGEKPLNVIVTMIIDITVCALLYGIFGAQYGAITLRFTNNAVPFAEALGNLLYFSTVVFTTVGFGDITPIGVSKAIMMAQGLSGQVLIAFFIVALYKKMMSR